MAAAMLETPSRVWRRIEEVEGRDMPSLPSLPGFDDSGDHETESVVESDVEQDGSPPIQSTPAVTSRTMSTIRPPSSTSSTARFAQSITSRSTKSALSASHNSAARQVPDESFDISSIPSLPDLKENDCGDTDIRSSDQESEDSLLHDSYPQPQYDGSMIRDPDIDLDLSEALQSVSRSNSPVGDDDPTPAKNYDYSVSLRSEKKPSPFDKMRNVSFRRPLSRNLVRTPSLTRTTPSPNSSASHSTPHSNRSLAFPRSSNASPLPALLVPLPRSATASPVVPPRSERDIEVESRHSSVEQEEQQNSMDITESLPRELNSSEQGHEDEREPTFSSEEAPTQSDHDDVSKSPGFLTAAFSSPAPSAMFTPTPAFQPRPRARFAAFPAASSRPHQYPTIREDTQQEITQDCTQDDPTTPHAHKRSFLLSVINSTARPRLKYPTPHPHRVGETTVQAPITPGVNLHKAFAGVTPRPLIRPRLAQPSTHESTSNSEAAPESGPESASEANTPSLLDIPALPDVPSPYDSGTERASFISTASSHDLTTHVRANTSFDPVIGLGERGHGVGRFNAGKLNSYLHGLNRRLQEENETLVLRLKTYEERYGRSAEAEPAAEEPVPQPQSRRSSAGSSGRRVSVGPGIGLGDLVEEAAEGWLEEKAALEEMIQDLKDEVQKCTRMKEQAEEVLDHERDERIRDKERWRVRMSEVEKGVSGIIQDLEQKAADAEKKVEDAQREKAEGVKELEKRLAAVVGERDALQDRVRQAEAALESGKELGAELNATNERIAQLTGDLRNANAQIEELEEEVMGADKKIDSLEQQLRVEKNRTSSLEERLQAKADALDEAALRVATFDEAALRAERAFQESKAYVAQLNGDADAAVECIQSLKEQLANAQDKISELIDEAEQDREEIERLSDEAGKASELARQLEEALEAAETKMLADEEEVAALKAKVVALERAEQEHVDAQASTSQASGSDTMELRAEIENLETELQDAQREIARLSSLLSQSPARKAIDKAKDVKIELLQKEKEDLVERVKSLRAQNNSLHATPVKFANTSGISPMHRQILSLSMKSPKTPGGPLRDLSWLQNTMNDPSVSPLVVEIARLQHELDRANESIDDKLDRLEDAGMGVVGLTKQLEDARSKILALEDDIGRLTRKEERRYRRLQRARCHKCHSKVDLQGLHRRADADESSLLEESTMNLASEPPTPPTRTSEALRANLQQVNAQLAAMKKAWEEEKRKLQGENAILQDAATRLNAEVRNAKRDVKRLVEAEQAGERARLSIQQELDKAKRVIDDLESELKEERNRLRTLTTEQSRVKREKDEIVLQLRRAESDMADVRDHLQRLKQENHELEHELRSNAVVEQKARLLETRVAANSETIEQLRQERSLLAADYKDLQSRYSKVSEHINELQDEYAASQNSHDERRHQLDLRLLEIEDLRRTLSEQADELQRADAEKKRIAAEKSGVAQTVAALEEDLRRVRRDAEAFGRDLKLLRAQKDRLEEEHKLAEAKAERAQKQSQTEIRILKEELETQRDMAKVATQQLEGHICAADDQQLVDLKLQHKKECKGLFAQIRYLKARFTRESAMRSDLGYQKQYLLVLLARLERNEQTILASIARIGFPVLDDPASRPKARKLKSVIHSVIFILRSKHASDQWREHCASRPAITAALQEVRRRRMENAAGGSDSHRS